MAHGDDARDTRIAARESQMDCHRLSMENGSETEKIVIPPGRSVK